MLSIKDRQDLIQLIVEIGAVYLPLTDIILGIATFTQLDSIQRLVAVTATSMWEYAEASDTWIEVDITGLEGGVLYGTQHHSVSFAHAAHASGTLADGYYFIISNGHNPVFVWDGAAAPQELSSDNFLAHQVVSYKESLLLLRPTQSGVESPQKIIWSQTGKIDEFDFTTTNAGFLSLFDTPGVIRGQGLLGDSLAIHKSDSIVMLSNTGGTDRFRADTVVRATGLAAQEALAVLEGEHIYLAKDGFKRWSGQVTPDDIGLRIFSDLNANINWSHAHDTRTVIDWGSSEVGFYVPSGSGESADRGYIYDWKHDTWAIDTLTNKITAINNWTQFTAVTWDDFSTEKWATPHTPGGLISNGGVWSEMEPDEAADVVVCGDRSGNVYKHEIIYPNEDAGDGDDAISQIHDTPDFVPDQARYQDRYVKYLSMSVEAKGISSSVLTVQYNLASGASGSWKTITTSQTITTTWTRYKLDFKITGRKIRFRFKNVVASANFNLRHYNVTFVLRGARG